MAIVHVGFSGAVDGSVLTNEILDNMQSRHVADESAKQSLPERVVSHSRPQPSIPVAPQRSQSSSSNTQGSTSAERSQCPSGINRQENELKKLLESGSS
ncbi:hypothetical protein EB796_008570 [Bugula neritina]|uniref:Uncharacterized protein n=1 Tax=Bugula neritina TaxID=10212 RepID=A0A7J7K3D8_BUGNE|nr:hypothetical protein EB796_008570 [Bugula neritina]